MGTIAQQTMYRDEYIAGYETRTSQLRGCVTTDTMTKGNQVYFLITKPNRTAVTRGANGKIPGSMDDLTQTAVTLVERHDKPQKTQFNIFTGQSDQRAIMQMESHGVINRDVDLMILDTLATTSVNLGGAAAMTKTLVNKALNALYKSKIPNDGNIYAIISPSAWLELSDIAGFASRDYVGSQTPLVGGMQSVDWMGVHWMMSPEIPGYETADETMFFWHKAAVGHALDSKGIQVFSGYNEEDDYSWARTTFYHGTALIQATGVVAVHHIGNVFG